MNCPTPWRRLALGMLSTAAPGVSAVKVGVVLDISCRKQRAGSVIHWTKR
jgi:hypothetical protein